MIKLEGRVLLFDEININHDKFSKDCKINFPEKVPLTWNFEHNNSIGYAVPVKDDKGIYATAEIFRDDYISVKDIRGIFANGKIGVGGYYNRVKKHQEEELVVIDEATLLEIGLTLAPVRDKYYFKIVGDEKNDQIRKLDRDNQGSI